MSGGFEIDGEVIPPRILTQQTYAQNYNAYSKCYLHEKRGSDIPCVFNKEDGAWISFTDCVFPDQGAGRCTVHICSNGCALLEIHTKAPDGPLIARHELPNTGDNCAVPWNQVKPVWTDSSFPLDKTLTGLEDIFFVFKGNTGIQSFIFS